jgi:hypothetical protein
MSHYVDVIFSRPQYREKSWLERIAFHILFPLSWIALIMAMTDAAKEHFRTYGMPEALVFADEVWRRLTPYLHRDNVVSRLPIPQVSCQFPKLDVRSCRLTASGLYRTGVVFLVLVSGAEIVDIHVAVQLL